MDFSKMTLKEATKFGFLIRLASPMLLFSPLDISPRNKTEKSVNDELAKDELRILSDYERANAAG